MLPVVVPIATTSGEGLSSAAPTVATAPRPPRRLWTWETDARDARTHAQRDRLPLVVYVRADWSAGALSMDRGVWSDPRILFHPMPVVALRVDLTDGPNAELWAEEFHVQALPTTLFFNEEGREVKRLNGAQSVDDVLAALHQLQDDTEDR